MELVILYLVVFSVLLLGIVTLSWVGFLSLKQAVREYMHPRSYNWFYNSFDILANFFIGVVRISIAAVFAFICYQMILEMIRIF